LPQGGTWRELVRMQTQLEHLMTQQSGSLRASIENRL
jgi:hypothetical protein